MSAPQSPAHKRASQLKPLASHPSLIILAICPMPSACKPLSLKVGRFTGGLYSTDACPVIDTTETETDSPASAACHFPLMHMATLLASSQCMSDVGRAELKIHLQVASFSFSGLHVKQQQGLMASCRPA